MTVYTIKEEQLEVNPAENRTTYLGTFEAVEDVYAHIRRCCNGRVRAGCAYHRAGVVYADAAGKVERARYTIIITNFIKRGEL